LSTTRGSGLAKEGITSKLGELETDLQFNQDQVGHDRFGLIQGLLMLLDSFPKPVSGSATHESIRTRLLYLSGAIALNNWVKNCVEASSIGVLGPGRKRL
jgi:hypothetical protein